MDPQIVHTADFVEEAVGLIVAAAREAIAERGQFRLSLSGGNTPKPVYQALAARTDVDWSKVLITFGDERCVPPDNAQSNYRMAREALLDHVPVPSGQILRLKGEMPPGEAAREYEQALASFGEPVFQHDLILLGMGDDGHTASLFPGTAALQETRRMVVENYVPKFLVYRLTFTYPLLNAARQVAFLVNSSGKEHVLSRVFDGSGDFPSTRVQPTSGRLTWLLGGGL